MKLLRTTRGFVVEQADKFYSLSDTAWTTTDWDALLTNDDLFAYLQGALPRLKQIHEPALGDIEAPIGNQEVWAAGVTYFRSRDARMEESKSAGGGDFYQRVYEAARPELFFKATPHRVVGPDDAVALRDDAAWSVPEPELTLLITPSGKITGYTIGNDMSSRDIEGQSLRSKLRTGSLDPGNGGAAASIDRDPARYRARRTRRVLRIHNARVLEAHTGGTGPVSVPEQSLPGRLLPVDRHRNRTAGLFHAP
jgi:hypothetical protein